MEWVGMGYFMGSLGFFPWLADLALKLGFLRPFVLDRPSKTPIIQALVKKASSLFEGSVFEKKD
jgi:hypothetical protein